MKGTQIAEYVIEELLKHGFVIHRYDAHSTCCIYLKLDYGACNSIRISDHNGYEHLSYKYNINQKIHSNRWYKDKKGLWRYECKANKESIDKLITIILEDRFMRKTNYDYTKLIDDYKSKINTNIGFWSGAKEVRL